MKQKIDLAGYAQLVGRIVRLLDSTIHPKALNGKGSQHLGDENSSFYNQGRSGFFRIYF